MPEETKQKPTSRVAKYWGGAQKTFVQRYRVVIVTLSVLVMLAKKGDCAYQGLITTNSATTRQKLAKKMTTALLFGLDWTGFGA